MCGVAFVWHRDPSLDVRAICRRMVEAQAHRGPEHQAVVAGDRFAIGHARLRVMDRRPSADQPIGTSGTGLLTYNGEIYDYARLRRALRADGAPFSTTGDAEVVHRVMSQWGPEYVDRLRGMFAFVYFRPNERRAWLVRDRMGIKPLCFALTEDAVVVASEAKGVLASGLLERALDPAAIRQVWRFNHCLGTRTAFEGVQQVAPGTVMTIDLERLHAAPRRYFRIHFEPGNDLDLGRRTDEFDAAFTDAVRAQLVADRPVGAYLSGGIDSAGIVSEAARQTSDLEAYTMTFDGDSNDEGVAARIVAAHTGVEHVEVPVGEPSLDDLVDFVTAAEMPQQWTSDLALKSLARRVGRRVVLAGEGPDELLAGYDAYRAMRVRHLTAWARPAELARSPWIRRAVLGRVAPWMALDERAVVHYLNHFTPAKIAERTARHGAAFEGTLTWQLLDHEQDDVLGPALRDRRAAFDETDDRWLREEVAPHTKSLGPLETNLYFETAVRLPSWVLHMGDRMSAAHGIELRFPYLHDEVVRVVSRLPSSDRLGGLTDKRILRRAHRRRLPRHVCRRPKQPLYAPIRPWLRAIFRSRSIDRFWAPEVFERTRFFSRDRCEALARFVLGDRVGDRMTTMTAEWALMLVLTTNILQEAS